MQHPATLITGASSGIGRQIALDLGKKGSPLILVGRNTNALENLKSELHAHNPKLPVTLHRIDFENDPLHAANHLAQLTQSVPLKGVVLAAGFGLAGEFTQLSIEKQHAMIDVNLRAVVQLAHHYGTRFKSERQGQIVLLSSILGFQGAPGFAVYAATKNFIQGFAEGLFYELRPHQVQVICVAPGPVHTAFANRANMSFWWADRPENVSRSVVQAMTVITHPTRCLTLRPGPVSRIMGYTLGLFPRRVRVWVLKIVLGTMQKK